MPGGWPPAGEPNAVNTAPCRMTQPGQPDEGGCVCVCVFDEGVCVSLMRVGVCMCVSLMRVCVCVNMLTSG